MDKVLSSPPARLHALAGGLLRHIALRPRKVRPRDSDDAILVVITLDRATQPSAGVRYPEGPIGAFVSYRSLAATILTAVNLRSGSSTEILGCPQYLPDLRNRHPEPH